MAKSFGTALVALAAVATLVSGDQGVCNEMTIDFIIKEGDPEAAAVENDIVQDLSKIGIKVNTRSLDADAYRQAELDGDYNMMFTRSWGAPYDPHSYLTSWDTPAHAEYEALGGMEPPLTRDELMARIADVQKETELKAITDKWGLILKDIHEQAIHLPLWGTRIPYVLNRRLGDFTPSTQTYSYPISNVQVFSGSSNVTVAPGAGGSLFKSLGPVHPHQYYPNQLFAQSWVYEGLVAYGQDGEITPALATSWKTEDTPSGGNRVTFTLREGVKFHDGSAWNCAAAKLNFDHVLSDVVKQRHQWYGTTRQLTSWSCNGAGQFVLETKDKYYPLLQELSYIRPLTFAAPSAFAQGINSDPDTHNSCNSGDFGSKYAYLEDTITCAGLKGPWGTGPFKLATQVTDSSTGIDTEAVFARHDDYWGTVPSIEFLHIKHYETQADVEKDLLSGDLDMALGIGPLSASQIQNLKFYHSDKLDVRHSAVMQHANVIMNTNAPHTRDIKTRQAIIHAVDKSRFLKEEFAGLEQPVTQLLPYDAPFCNVDLNPKWAYDFEKARLLNCPVPPPATVTVSTTAAGNTTGSEGDREKDDDDDDSNKNLTIALGVLGAVLFLCIIFVIFVVMREKRGDPVFTPLEG